ncbi:DUF418 domain-containing protein [Brachybacterium hainanense]|uniref:DUF418 domain-containing protein n=1 Tax=Brachybacterium hainanense TaxID=1541174 RepID=A0ABV6RG10_9MICO
MTVPSARPATLRALARLLAGERVAVTAVPLSQRAAGPDLARGAALAGIALANTVGWMYGGTWTALAKQADAGPLDRTVDVLVSLLADNRGFPMFALLFGYGIGVLHRRGQQRGETAGAFRRRMARRHLVLAGIGLAHGVLLFPGDIILPYAVIGMLAVLFASRSRRIVMLGALIAAPMLALWGWSDGLVGLQTGIASLPAVQAGDYGTSVLIRAQETGWALLTMPATDLGLLTPMLIGLLMARGRVLEDVTRNRETLASLVRWLLPLSLLGAAPLTWVMVRDPWHEAVTSPALLGGLGVLHQLTGLAGAVAYAAGAALLCAGYRRGRARTGRRALVALGRMSLTAYLLQSLLALAVFPAYTFGLGGRLGSAGASAIMLGTWAAGLVLAWILARRGRRGPAEQLLRTLARPVPEVRG